jgi:hypothetical protein
VGVGRQVDDLEPLLGTDGFTAPPLGHWLSTPGLYPTAGQEYFKARLHELCEGGNRHRRIITVNTSAE